MLKGSNTIIKDVMISHGPDDTCILAMQIADQLTPGATIALRGDLGSGKTVFARALARALGVQGTISSPTYTIQQSYQTSTQTLHHIDLYRLSSAEEVDMLDLEACWEGEAITVIEWADRAKGLLPENTWHITFTPGDHPNIRHIKILRPANTPQTGVLR